MPRMPRLAVDALQEMGHAHLGEHVVVVGSSHVVEPERDGGRPPRRDARSGAMPAPSRRFEEALWTTVSARRGQQLDVGSRAARRRVRARCGRRARRCAARRSSSRPPAKASPQARCRRLSSACRWTPAPSSAAAAPTASTSSSLAHCGAMIANWALSSGSSRELAARAADRRDVGVARHRRAGEAARSGVQIGRQRRDESVVAVVCETRAVAPVRCERDALTRCAVGAQRLAELARVRVARARPGPRPTGSACAGAT